MLLGVENEWWRDWLELCFNIDFGTMAGSLKPLCIPVLGCLDGSGEVDMLVTYLYVKDMQ